MIKTRTPSLVQTRSEKVYLGLWACSWNESEESPLIDGQVLPFRWDDRELMAKDFEYLQDLFQRVIKTLRNDLNDLHQVDYSLRAWKILVGPFALHLLHSLFDRYHAIQTACNSNQQLVTNTYECSFAPKNLAHWFQLLATDEFNEILYSKILSVVDTSIQPQFQGNLSFVRTLGANKGGKGFVKVLSSRVCKYFNSILIQRRNSHLSARETLTLYRHLKQIPAFEPDFLPKNCRWNWELRSKKLDFSPQDSFEEVLQSIFYWFFPNSLMEAFEQLHEFTSYYLPKNLKHVLMGGSFGNEFFSMSCALASEKGAKLSLYQHGGLYGTTRYSSAERYELDITDHYLSWGWQGNKVKPFYINKVLNVKPDQKKGKILVGLVSQMRYVYRLDSWIQGPQTFECGQAQIEFAKTLNPEVRKETVFRFHRNYGWNEQDRFLKEFPELNCESISDSSFHESISKAKLFVGTYNTTMLLECMSGSFPCLFFWNPKHEEIRTEAKPYYDLLHDAKILFYSPLECAEFVNKISDDVMSWWTLEKTQLAVRTFCSLFAVKSDNLISELADHLRSYQS